MSLEIQIRNAIIDPSKQQSLDGQIWGKAPQALKIMADAKLPPELESSNVSVERYALSDQPFAVVIGGLCSIFTGDMKDPQSAIRQIRADQLTEAVGLIPEKPALVVIEDSLFAQMFPAIGVNDFQRQGALFETYFNNFAKLNRIPYVTYVYTSQIEEALLETAKELSMRINDKNFMSLSSAPVLVMYTNLWSKLLSDLTFLDCQNVLCFEPTPHFAPNKNLTTIDQRRAFENYLKYLNENPYGKKGENSNFSIAGYTSNFTLDSSRNRLRLKPIQEVITNQNYSEKLLEIRSQTNTTDYSPFPLVGNAVAGLAFNWLLFSQEAKDLVTRLICLQSEYYWERKNGNLSPESKRSLKPSFTEKATPVEQQILDIAQSTFDQVFEG
ncbi:hypothetical protein A3B57_02005 [Microgenomates group bacterium RIFCSPLOWO2_01_FULL_47_10]|nr:MAG: hypothetical protein A3B57_02005 [Microgenomates group bacterium RIFCSPLOWO2_01_FULL_47_10]